MNEINQINYYQIRRGYLGPLRTGILVKCDEIKKRILVRHGNGKERWIRESQVKHVD